MINWLFLCQISLSKKNQKRIVLLLWTQLIEFEVLEQPQSTATGLNCLSFLYNPWGSNLAQEINHFVCKITFWIFWHPWDLCCVNITKFYKKSEFRQAQAYCTDIDKDISLHAECIYFGFLQKKQADEKQVVLSNVSILATEGNYKCQVSGEGPLFATAAQTKRLRVAST